MKITVVCAGKLKEKYLRDGVAEYEKRLRPYANLQIIEISEERMRDKPSSSEELSAKIDHLSLAGESHFVFLIGGPFGLSNELRRRADFRLAFSQFTLPHQLIRLFLLEQIYRLFKISRHEPYHL